MIINSLLEGFILPVADFFSGTTFVKDLGYWRNIVNNSNENELQQLQKQNLQSLLNHTIQSIPFYQKQNIQLTNNPYADIKQFPIMHKNLMKNNLHELLIYDKNKMVSEKSSGSSGIQGEVFMTVNESRKYQAIQTALWEWSGYKLGLPFLQTGMTLNRGLLKSIKDFLFRVQYVNAYNLNKEQIIKNLHIAKKRNCKYFGGYASSLNVYAQTAIEEKIHLNLNGVIAWGDKLFEHYKHNIANAFGNPILTELYGTTEGFVISATCKYGNHHLLTPQTYIELLDKNGNEVKPGEIGYVVTTRLDAPSFPLIRYYLGDLAIKADEHEKCKCGRALPILKKIIGRDTDIIHTPTGKALIVHFFTGIFEHFNEIKQFRVIQKTKNNIEIEFIPSETFTQFTLEKIKAEIYKKAEEAFPITFSEVSTIPATASGKPQIVQNLIAEKIV
ncbi:MAG: phenylacetate--CoA ligase family protein [Bacteroidetes bacterium]|nr:phenylacetate--CoA ligase family protein [Bacteroidota bacterium]MBS1648744.1 phenylacetate--CoA ligase family protein [Bacteroidota bacterium]